MIYLVMTIIVLNPIVLILIIYNSSHTLSEYVYE